MMVNPALTFILIVTLLGMVSNCSGESGYVAEHSKDMASINLGSSSNVANRDFNPLYFLLYDDKRCANRPYEIRHEEYKRRFDGKCFAFGSNEYYSVFTYRGDTNYYTGGSNDDGGCVQKIGAGKVNHCTWWNGGSTPLSGAITPHGAY